MTKVCDINAQGVSFLRDMTPAEEALLADAPPVPAPLPTRQDIAIGSVKVTLAAVAGVVGYGFASASRLALGRVRLYFAVQQPDANYIVLASIQNSADATCRVSAKTVDYVEIRSNLEVAEYAVQVTRIA